MVFWQYGDVAVGRGGFSDLVFGLCEVCFWVDGLGGALVVVSRTI